MSEKENKKRNCGCEHDDCSHDKHHECDCGCDHDGCDCETEEDIIELTMDNGEKIKFFFVGTIEYKGKIYSAFEPAEEREDMSEDDLYIFEVSGEDEETADLLPVEDEDLLEEVFEEFCRLLDEEDLADEAMELEDGE